MARIVDLAHSRWRIASFTPDLRVSHGHASVIFKSVWPLTTQVAAGSSQTSMRWDNPRRCRKLPSCADGWISFLNWVWCFGTRFKVELIDVEVIVAALQKHFLDRFGTLIVWVGCCLVAQHHGFTRARLDAVAQRPAAPAKDSAAGCGAASISAGSH